MVLPLCLQVSDEVLRLLVLQEKGGQEGIHEEDVGEALSWQRQSLRFIYAMTESLRKRKRGVLSAGSARE